MTYSSNFLTDVVVRLDFPKILGMDRTKPPASFQEAISERYPLLTEMPGKLYEFSASDKDVALSQEETLLWRFENKEKNKNIRVAPNFIHVEFAKYTSFADFQSDYEFIFKKFFELYPVVRTVNRIGLRFINQIRLRAGDPFEWADLISPDLYCVTRSFIKPEEIVKRSLHQLLVKQGDSDLNFIFGSFNSEYPNPISKREFVLDYDCFSKTELDTADIYGRIEEFRGIITEWFERSICDGLRSMMNSDNFNEVKL